MRRASLEYVLTTGDGGGNFRSGQDEGKLEKIERRRGAEHVPRFQVNEDAQEVVDAVFAKVPSRKVVTNNSIKRENQRKSVFKREEGGMIMGAKAISREQMDRNFVKRKQKGKVSVKCKTSSSSSSPPKPAAAALLSATKYDRTVVSPSKRLEMKQSPAVNGIKARVRPNVRAKIQELDRISFARWDVTSKLDYQVHLPQGIEVVSKNDKIDWVWEPFNFQEIGVDPQDPELLREKRLRRARYSTSCANLFS